MTPDGLQVALVGVHELSGAAELAAERPHLGLELARSASLGRQQQQGHRQGGGRIHTPQPRQSRLAELDRSGGALSSWGVSSSTAIRRGCPWVSATRAPATTG